MPAVNCARARPNCGPALGGVWLATGVAPKTQAKAKQLAAMRKCERLARGEKSRKADDEKADDEKVGDEKAGDGKAVMVKVRKRKNTVTRIRPAQRGCRSPSVQALQRRPLRV
jgi:hypothetical protein